jgi:putative membrane protein
MTSRRISRILTAFTGAVLLIGTSALAQMRPGESAPQSPSNPTTDPNGSPNGVGTTDSMQQQQTAASGQMQDKAFVRKAMEGGMAEVQLGQLALGKASTPDVKQFGQKMVDDHTKLDDQMQPLAQQLGVAAPTKLSKKDETEKAKLQSLSGAQFDDAYIKLMLKDHKKDASDFKDEAQHTQNPNLQQATLQGAQVIDQHLQLIEQIAQSHNISNGKGKTTGAGQ